MKKNTKTKPCQVLGEISFGFDYENLQFNQIFVQVNLDLIIDTYERLD